MRERHGRVLNSREVTANVTLVTVETLEPQTITSRAGQFVSLRTPAGGRRSYSVVSSSGSMSRFELVLKSSIKGGGTDSIAAALTPTSRVDFFGPMGFFLFEPKRKETVIFGATGVGISAVLPMIGEALESDCSQVKLFWGLREPTDLFLADRLDSFCRDRRFCYQLALSGRGEGHITAPLVSLAKAATDPAIYLCGHGQMIADVADALPNANLKTEVFFAPRPQALPSVRDFD